MNEEFMMVLAVIFFTSTIAHLIVWCLATRKMVRNIEPKTPLIISGISFCATLAVLIQPIK